MKLKPETLEAHRQRHSRTPREQRHPAGGREATLEEKERWLGAVSRGFTRSLYHDTPIEDLPLYHNGHAFYLLQI